MVHEEMLSNHRRRVTHVGVSKLDHIIFDNDVSPDQPVCDTIVPKCVIRPRRFFSFFFYKKTGIR